MGFAILVTTHFVPWCPSSNSRGFLFPQFYISSPKIDLQKKLLFYPRHPLRCCTLRSSGFDERHCRTTSAHDTSSRRPQSCVPSLAAPTGKHFEAAYHRIDLRIPRIFGHLCSSHNVCVATDLLPPIQRKRRLGLDATASQE